MKTNLLKYTIIETIRVGGKGREGFNRTVSALLRDIFLVIKVRFITFEIRADGREF